MFTLVWSIKEMKICRNLVKPSVNAVLNRLSTILFLYGISFSYYSIQGSKTSLHSFPFARLRYLLLVDFHSLKSKRSLLQTRVVFLCLRLTRSFAKILAVVTSHVLLI